MLQVAIVSPHPVSPAVSGDKLRTVQLMEALQSHAVEPSLVVLDWDSGRAVAQADDGLHVGARPRTVIARAWWRAGLAIARRSNPYAIFERDGIRARLTKALDTLPALVEDYQHSFMWQPSRRATICTFHNIESDEGKQERSGGDRHRRALRTQERRAANGCDIAVVFSAEDRDRLGRIAPAAEIRLVPLGFEPTTAGLHKIRSGLSTVGFVGSFSYAPNVEAAGALIELAPRLQESGVDRVKIIGSGASAHFTSSLGIEVHSDVPSVPEALEDVDLLVVPLVHGGGVRVKLIEALAMGLPIVTTAVGAEGLDLRDDVHAIVVQAVADLPAGVARARSSAVRVSLAAEGRRLWEKRYSPTQMASGMAGVYQDAVALAADRNRAARRGD